MSVARTPEEAAMLLAAEEEAAGRMIAAVDAGAGALGEEVRTFDGWLDGGGRPAEKVGEVDAASVGEVVSAAGGVDEWFDDGT